MLNLSGEEEFDKNVNELPEKRDGDFQKYNQSDKSFVGKLPEYPHPIESNISSRMMVDHGVLTATMAAAAVVGGFLASAVSPVTSFVFAIAFATPVYVIFPVAKPFIKGSTGVMFSDVAEAIEELQELHVILDALCR